MAGFWQMFQAQPPAAPQNINGGQAPNTQPNGNFQQRTQGAQQQNEPGHRPQNGATVPNEGNNNNQNNGNQPGPNNQNTNSQQQTNPLDTYSKIFDTTNTKGDAPPAFAIDPKQMDSIVQGLDFTTGIDPTVMQKATQGDAASLMQIIQAVGRNSYRAAIEHGGVLTDKFVGARESYSSKGFPQKVRQELVTNQLASNTPNFQHPVVRQQLTEIASRFQAQHPDATAKEIGDMSIKYLQDLMDAIRPPEDKTKQSSGQQTEERGEEFWNNYFQMDDQQTQ